MSRKWNPGEVVQWTYVVWPPMDQPERVFEDVIFVHPHNIKQDKAVVKLPNGRYKTVPFKDLRKKEDAPN